MAEVMTGRELLELAAKAAGLQLCGYCWVSDNEGDDECSELESAFVKHRPTQELATTWNPLTDDGDALRLAVRLEFEVSLGQFGTIVYLKHGKVEEIGAAGCDAMSLCRRAIVHAAAEIGKGV